MDDDVLAAMAKWPSVPAVFGWLSLTPRGHWRLHPRGEAREGGPGESITNERVNAFIGRNYSHDAEGRWFFQNGPQRVYVRIDGAPYVLRASAAGELETHTGLAVGRVEAWHVDEDGRLYAATEHGLGLIDDRELGAVLERLRTPDGRQAADSLEAALESAQGARGIEAFQVRHGGLDDAGAPLSFVPRGELGRRFGIDFDPAPAALSS